MMFLSRWSRRSRPLHRPNAVLTQALISTLLAHVKVTRITDDFRAGLSAPPGAVRHTVEGGRAGRDRRPRRNRTCFKGAAAIPVQPYRFFQHRVEKAVKYH